MMLFHFSQNAKRVWTHWWLSAVFGGNKWADKNIILLTIGLFGRRSKEIILGKFKLDETRFAISGCPAWNNPQSSSYIKQEDSIRVSLHWNQFEGRPYKEQCSLELKKQTGRILILLNSRKYAIFTDHIIIYKKSVNAYKLSVLRS